MAFPPRLPTLALLLTILSLGLNLAIIGTAARTLHVFDSNRLENVYFLPIWNSHLDMRGLQGLIGTSAVVVVCNIVLAIALYMSTTTSTTTTTAAAAATMLPTNPLALGSSALSTVISTVALAFQAAQNNNAPRRDTLQTWTCSWKDVHGEGVPRSFDTLCNETRFAFYATIPSFLVQLMLLALGFYALSTRSASAAQKRRSVMRLDEEKDHELVQRQQQEFDGKFDSARSTPDKVRVLAGKE